MTEYNVYLCETIRVDRGLTKKKKNNACYCI